jgi:hypothetical protein
MKRINAHAAAIAALLASSAALSGLVDHGWYGTEQAFAASPEQKAEAREELDQVIASLSRVDAAYASGDAPEAQTNFEEARSSWNKISAAIAAREAQEAQLVWDSLGGKLKSGAPPAEVNSTVYGILEQLNEDIAGQLK